MAEMRMIRNPLTPQFQATGRWTTDAVRPR
jgi:hypothetical protein